MHIPTDLLDKITTPLARLCLRYGVRFQELTTSLKKSLVSEATHILVNEKVGPTVAKLSVMTGLQRPDVVKHSSSETACTKPSVISQIVSAWLYSGRFRNKRGEPRVLSPEGKDSEFAKLVASVSKELSPYAVLFEMERAGLIEHTDDGVRLISSTHLVSSDTNAGLGLLAQDLRDLTDAVSENLNEPSSPHLHLRLEYDNLPPEKIAEIRSRVFQLAHAYLHQIQEIVASYDRDVLSSGNGEDSGTIVNEPRARFSLGMFSYTEPVDARTIGKTVTNESDE